MNRHQRIEAYEHLEGIVTRMFDTIVHTQIAGSRSGFRHAYVPEAVAALKRRLPVLCLSDDEVTEYLTEEIDRQGIATYGESVWYSTSDDIAIRSDKQPDVNSPSEATAPTDRQYPFGHEHACVQAYIELDEIPGPLIKRAVSCFQQGRFSHDRVTGTRDAVLAIISYIYIESSPLTELEMGTYLTAQINRAAVKAFGEAVWWSDTGIMPRQHLQSEAQTLSDIVHTLWRRPEESPEYPCVTAFKKLLLEFSGYVNEAAGLGILRFPNQSWEEDLRIAGGLLAGIVGYRDFEKVDQSMRDLIAEGYHSTPTVSYPIQVTLKSIALSMTPDARQLKSKTTEQ